MNKLFIFDIDGVLADCTHRSQYLAKKPKDYENFYAKCLQDTPITSGVALLNTLYHVGHDIYFFTGRRASSRACTVTWLDTHTVLPTDYIEPRLSMRPNSDWSPAYKLKASWYERLNQEDKDRLVAIFEDDPFTVATYREMGLICYQP